MKIHQYNQAMKWLTRPSDKITKDRADKFADKLGIKKEDRLSNGSTKTKPMNIIKYIDRMNRIYGSSETDEYGNVESATDRIQEKDRIEKDFFQNKLKNLQKAPVKIVKKPTVLELLEFEDYLNTLDPNYWIPEEKPKPKPEDKTRIIRTGITKLI